LYGLLNFVANNYLKLAHFATCNTNRRPDHKRSLKTLGVTGYQKEKLHYIR